MVFCRPNKIHYFLIIFKALISVRLDSGLKILFGLVFCLTHHLGIFEVRCLLEPYVKKNIGSYQRSNYFFRYQTEVPQNSRWCRKRRLQLPLYEILSRTFLTQYLILYWQRVENKFIRLIDSRRQKFESKVGAHFSRFEWHHEYLMQTLFTKASQKNYRGKLTI
jgi:hypothetical protein